MVCQDCGVHAETKYVSFHQNIGALVMRFSQKVEGELCKSCIKRHFWTMTLITFLFGWWGIISFVLTPFFLLNNVIYGLRSLGMEPAPPRVALPRLSNAAVQQIKPYARELRRLLKRGEDLTVIAEIIAEQADVTPEEVIAFAQLFDATPGESGR